MGGETGSAPARRRESRGWLELNAVLIGRANPYRHHKREAIGPDPAEQHVR